MFGLQYLQKNTGVSYEISGQKDLRDSLDLRLTYITIPVLMRVYSSNRKTYVSGGFDLGFLRDGSLKNVQTGSGEDVTGWFKDIDLSLCLGFGIMIPVGDLFLDLEIKYAQSILAIGEMQELDLQQDMPIRIRTSGFQLNTGIAFDL